EEDEHLSHEIARGLESHEIPTWYYERDSLPGIPYLVQVGQAIDGCSAIVILISASALSSNQITAEVVRGYESSKPFVPVLVDISYGEFQAQQPLWRQALSGYTSIKIPSSGVKAIL